MSASVLSTTDTIAKTSLEENVNGILYSGISFTICIARISKKVTSAKRIKVKRGEYFGRAPLGYIRSTTIKTSSRTTRQGNNDRLEGL